MSCLVAKPVVDGIEQALEGRASVYRVNITSADGRQLAGHYGIRMLPTLIVVDGQGEAVLQQTGHLNKAAVLEAISLHLTASNP